MASPSAAKSIRCFAFSPRCAASGISAAATSSAGRVMTAAPAASPAQNAAALERCTASSSASVTHIVAGTSLIGCFAYVMKSGFHATIAVAKSAVSGSTHSRASRCTSHSVMTPITGATKKTDPAPPIHVKSAITAETPIGNVGAIPSPPAAGAHPSGDASATRFGADSHSAMGAGSIR